MLHIVLGFENVYLQIGPYFNLLMVIGL